MGDTDDPAAKAGEDQPNKSFFSRFKKNSPDDNVEQQEEVPKVSISALFRFTTLSEKLMMVFSLVCAAIHGALLPLFIIVFGQTLGSFGDVAGDPTLIVAKIQGLVKWYIILAAGALVTSFVQVRFQMIAAQRSSARIRRLYFRSLMRQEPGWYDSENTGELTSRVASDVDLIQAGIGDKVGSSVQFLSSFVVGFIIAFFYSWKLTLIILAVTPLLVASGAFFAKLMTDSVDDSQGSYGGAGAVAHEALALIRTVVAFGGQDEETARYEKKLDSAFKAGVRKSFFQGAGMGMTFFFIFAVYALAFWYGDRMIRRNEIQSGDLFISFFAVLIGAMSLGQAAPGFSALAVARGAAPRIFEVIDRQSDIDPLSDDGLVLDSVNGELQFENLTFNYASRAAEGGDPVLNNLNLTIKAGTVHALVGPSGCGKSSTMNFIMRFYDPDVGRVLLDGVDIKDLNVRYLRSQIGYVGQMPTLFRASIRENIAYGAAIAVRKDGESANVDAMHLYDREEITDEQIVAAARLANAHDFITKLPDGYDTMLGDRGALLSGGQKQRICIARAIVRNPKILCLDEATSALDAQSERVVQEALEKAAEGRTTVVIAHRLSTVRHANTISVFKDGVIVESGRHDDLISRQGGVYRELVELQNVAMKKKEEESADATDTESASVVGLGRHVSAQKATSMSNDMARSSYVETAQEEKLPDVDKGVYLRAFRYNSSETLYILLGMLGGAVAGAAWPLSALPFSETTTSLGRPGGEGDVRFWALMYVVIGIAVLIGNMFQFAFLGLSGEKLTRRMRANAFRALLKQEVGYFDEKEHSVGALTTRLATEASLVKGITGEILGALAIAFSCLIIGIIIAFTACWRLALVVLAMLPFLAVSTALQQKLMSGFDAGAKKDFIEAGMVASETVDNIRTVTSLGVQDVFMERYNNTLVPPLVKGQRSATIAGVGFGFGEGFQFILWAVTFAVGAKFIEKGWCDFLQILKAITGLFFAGMQLGNVAAFVPDIAASRVAATNIFRLLDRISKIDPSTKLGQTVTSVEGGVDVKEAKFEYPTRPNVSVLRGMTLKASPGQTVAIVGQSGSGKSTVVSLLERFYDVRSGSVNLDSDDLRSLELQSARAQMALVQQEPDLFNRSIRDNIAYGLSKEEGTPVTDAQIEEAARLANAHDFISELPEGYNTSVGERGSALSGGQRQRIAIARALIREPRILLLDEATSALDARSERVVQDALEKAARGRTTIVIAHRLSTIKNADVIAFVKRGKISELGTHDELMARGGGYADLVKNQMEG